ncbi:MAG: TIR domain-containing protein [Lachnospiraceae bacterium]|nr:TIR domain-containing protein [Lachnospiraceae bacterium]
MDDKRKYTAFISYRHLPLDKRIAKKVHTRIEHYRIPAEYRERYKGDRLGIVFRDEEELTASGNLSENIMEALDNSDFLIVICSPDTRDSVWVLREIEHFLKNHKRDHVLAVLIKGTPSTSFPDRLLHEYDEGGTRITGNIEPLAANLTDTSHNFSPFNLSREMTRIYAAILSMPFDDLWQRERRYRQTRIAIGLTAALLVSLSFSAVVMSQNRQIKYQNREIEENSREIEERNKEIEERNKEIEERNKQIEERNKQIEVKNDQIEEDNNRIRAQVRELKKRESEILVNEGNLLLEKGDRKGAIQSFIKALHPKDSEADKCPKAEKMLAEARGAYQSSVKLKTDTVIENGSIIYDMKLDPQGEYLYIIGEDDDVSCFKTESGERVWSADKNSTESSEREGLFMKDLFYETSSLYHKKLITAEGKDFILCDLSNSLMAVSADNGEIRWMIGRGYENDLCSLSETGEELITLTDTDEISLINTGDGSVIKKSGLSLPKELSDRYGFRSYGHAEDHENNGAFSPDGKKFIFALDLEEVSEGDTIDLNKGGAIVYYEWDIKDNSVSPLAYEETDSSYSPGTILGIRYKDDDRINIYRYDMSDNSLKMLRIDKKTQKLKTDVSEQLLKNTAGRAYYDKGNQMHVLTGGRFDLVSIDDQVHVIDSEKCVHMGSLAQNDDVCSMEWLDEGMERPVCLNADGKYMWYHLDIYEMCDEFGGGELIEDAAIMKQAEISESLFSYDGYDTVYNEDAYAAVRDKGSKREIRLFKTVRDKHGIKVFTNEKRIEKPGIKVKDGKNMLCLYIPNSENGSYDVFVVDPFTKEVSESYTVGYEDLSEGEEYSKKYALEGYRSEYDDVRGVLSIRDGKTGDLIHEEKDVMDTDGEMLAEKYEDKLFFSNDEFLLCLDADSYETLFTLRGNTVIDHESGKLYFVSIYAEEDNYVTEFPIYDTEMLINWERRMTE